MTIKPILRAIVFSAAASLVTVTPVFADEDETPLAEEMSTLSSSLKKLRKAKTTEDKVALVHQAQVSTIKSLEYLPMTFENIADPQEKAKATADYKRLMGLSYVKLCELETAFLEGDEEKADLIKDQLKDLKKEGHQKYEDE